MLCYSIQIGPGHFLFKRMQESWPCKKVIIGRLRPLYSVQAKVFPLSSNDGTREQELYPVKWTFEWWWLYILGHNVIVETDHANL